MLRKRYFTVTGKVFDILPTSFKARNLRLLDFTGGSMDICQMVLQASNTADWSAFYGNPVKFSLGLISMLFDVIFIVQHYILYNDKVVYYCHLDKVHRP